MSPFGKFENDKIVFERRSQKAAENPKYLIARADEAAEMRAEQEEISLSLDLDEKEEEIAATSSIVSDIKAAVSYQSWKLVLNSCRDLMKYKSRCQGSERRDQQGDGGYRHAVHELSAFR